MPYKENRTFDEQAVDDLHEEMWGEARTYRHKTKFGDTLVIDVGTKAKEVVFEMVVNHIVKYEFRSGESAMQSDNNFIHSPGLIAEIIDRVLEIED